MIQNQTHQLYKLYLKPLARHLRKNSTLSEVLLWNKLKNRQLLGYKFRRQTAINKYIVDLYCKELKLVVEVDGFSHDFKIDYDIKRDQELRSLGLHIIRINDLDVKKDIQQVIQVIVDRIEEITTGSSATAIPRLGGVASAEAGVGEAVEPKTIEPVGHAIVSPTPSPARAGN